MALSYIIRHGGLKLEYLDKNPGDVMPARRQDHDSGWQESSAAGQGGEGFDGALGAGRGQRLCCRQKGNIFPCSVILASEDQRKIFLNPFQLILMASYTSHLATVWGKLEHIREPLEVRDPIGTPPVLVNGLGLGSTGT